MELTERQRRALQALGRISAGEAAFLSILDADDLVGLGLADRYCKGEFTLTDAGRELLHILALSRKTSTME
jgi:hypothetical protein